MKKIMIVMATMMLMMMSLAAADYTIEPLNAKSGEECYAADNFRLQPSDGDENTGYGSFTSMRQQNDWYGCGIRPRAISPDNLASATGMTLRLLIEYQNLNGDTFEPDGNAVRQSDGYIRSGCAEEILFGGAFNPTWKTPNYLLTTSDITKQWVEIDLTTECLAQIRDQTEIDGQIIDELGFQISMPEYSLTGAGGQFFGGVIVYEWEILITEVSNTEPVINSLSPSARVELVNGESQVFSADVTDTEDDGNYSWTLGGIVVSTSETYTANWDDIAAGIYTLQLEVSDAEYSDTATTTLEIRARGGSASGGSSSNDDQGEDNDAQGQDDDAGKIQPKQQNKVQQFFRNAGESIANFFRNFFRRG